MLVGTDGGIHMSYDRGRTWDFVNTVPLGQFYEVGVDKQKPYNVYGGLQDNGSWGGAVAHLVPAGDRATTSGSASAAATASTP